jgi:glycosyltransferase involved in cell wall biosynthesis
VASVSREKKGKSGTIPIADAEAPSQTAVPAAREFVAAAVELDQAPRKTGRKAAESAEFTSARSAFAMSAMPEQPEADRQQRVAPPDDPLQGHIDEASSSRIVGWVWDPQQPERRIALELVDGDTRLTKAVADQYRPDLRLAAIGDGRHGFVVSVEEGLLTSDRNVLHLRCAETGREVPGSPVIIERSMPASAAVELVVDPFDEPAEADPVADPLPVDRLGKKNGVGPAMFRLTCENRMVPGAQTELESDIDLADRTGIRGWIWNPQEPKKLIVLELLDGDTLLATMLASEYREELEQNNIGDGRHGFSIRFGETLLPYAGHDLRLRPVRSINIDAEFLEITDGWFDPAFYASVYKDVDSASAVTLAAHFHYHGWKEGRDPSPNFSTAHYQSAYRDAQLAEINPLVYHVLIGGLRGHVPAKSLAVPALTSQELDANRIPMSSSAITVVDPELRRFAFDVGRALSPSSNVFNRSALDIHWIIPDFAPGAGGHMNIFRICNYLEAFGHKITIWIRDPVVHKDVESARQTLHRHYQPLRGPIHFVDDTLTDASGDIVVATDAWTVPIACSAWMFKRRFYFVQDFEAAFYPMSARYLLAESTYRMDLDCVCGGPWLESLMTEKYGRWARKFWQAADRSVYRPVERKSVGPNPRIAFYCRAFTDRRVVDFGLLALELLARRGVSFHVDFFGQHDLPFSSVPYSATNHGVCDAPALARIYQKADIGVVFSATNYSIVPQEMMACRLPLLDLDVESTRAVYDPGIVRMAKPEPRAIAEAIQSMLADPDGCAQQADRAAAWVNQFSWAESARLVQAAFVERLSELGFEPAKPAVLPSPEFFATVVIPTLNGGDLLKEVVERVLSQVVPGKIQLICIDSGSTDGTAKFLESQAGVELIKIKKAEFQHGRTRNAGVAAARSEFVAFLTQDALPVDDRWLYNLVCTLMCYPQAGGVFGRHIAHEHVSDFVKRDIDAHFAEFDDLPICASLADPEIAKLYANVSGRRNLHFYSDNNSCLRKSIWNWVPLPEVDFAEDQLFALELLKNGYGKAYARNAVVYHSHDDPPEIVEERCYTEARSFYEHFGYRLVQSRYAAASDLKVRNRQDLLFAKEQGVAKEAVARRLAQNKARADGYLRAMRDCRLVQ